MWLSSLVPAVFYDVKSLWCESTYVNVDLPGVDIDLLEWMWVYLCTHSSTCAGAIIITNTYGRMSNKITLLYVIPMVKQACLCLSWVMFCIIYLRIKECLLHLQTCQVITHAVIAPYNCLLNSQQTHS